jgi:hypothetical protein
MFSGVFCKSLISPRSVLWNSLYSRGSFSKNFNLRDNHSILRRYSTIKSTEKSNSIVQNEFSTPPLSSIVRLELFEKETPEDIQDIWLGHLKNVKCLAAVVPGSAYKHFKSRFKKFPYFILPWERTEGTYVPVMFFATDNSHFYTIAEDIQKLPNSHNPQLVINFYTELMETKDLVLMKGDFLSDIFNPDDGQYLAGLTQIFYLNEDWFKNYVQVCNQNPEEFDFKDVVKLVTSIDERHTGDGEVDEEGEGDFEDEIYSTSDLVAKHKDDEPK